MAGGTAEAVPFPNPIEDVAWTVPSRHSFSLTAHLTCEELSLNWPGRIYDPSAAKAAQPNMARGTAEAVPFPNPIEDVGRTVPSRHSFSLNARLTFEEPLINLTRGNLLSLGG